MTINLSILDFKFDHDRDIEFAIDYKSIHIGFYVLSHFYDYKSIHIGF